MRFSWKRFFRLSMKAASLVKFSSSTKSCTPARSRSCKPVSMLGSVLQRRSRRDDRQVRLVHDRGVLKEFYELNSHSGNFQLITVAKVFPLYKRPIMKSPLPKCASNHKSQYKLIRFAKAFWPSNMPDMNLRHIRNKKQSHVNLNGFEKWGELEYLRATRSGKNRTRGLLHTHTSGAIRHKFSNASYQCHISYLRCLLGL